MRLSLYFLLLVSVTSNLAAESSLQSHGFYGEIGLGRGYNNVSPTLFSVQPSYLDGSWVAVLRTAVGFDIDSTIGIEVGNRLFKQAKKNNLQGSGRTGRVDETAYSVQTVIRYPLSNSTSIMAKFGPAYVQFNQSVDGAATNLISRNVKRWQPAYGLAIATTLEDYPGVSAMFEYSEITGDSDHQLPKSEMYILGLMFHF
jgi:hypothetical protein